MVLDIWERKAHLPGVKCNFIGYWHVYIGVFFQDDNIHHSRKGDYVIIEMELKNFIQNGQNISLLKWHLNTYVLVAWILVT